MNANLLVDNIVRQTTILIAQLATSGGVRAPLAHIANQVFLELAKELESQGLSKQVTADMFGMALRSYRRRVQRLEGSATDRGRSLWEAVLAFLSEGGVVTRAEVLRRFARDDEAQVRSVLHDLCESALVFRLGSGNNSAYRAATADELSALDPRGSVADDLVWVVIYRSGPITKGALATELCTTESALEDPLQRLEASGRIQRSPAGELSSAHAVMPVGAGYGWEAAMFDHFQSVVNTLCARLTASDETASAGEVGGSTYSFNVWPGHPYEEQVRGALAHFRAQHTQLRQQVQEFNSKHAPPPECTRVVVYGGQYTSEQHTTEQHTTGQHSDAATEHEDRETESE